MLIAHLPAGYLVTTAVVGKEAPNAKSCFAAGLLGSVCLDLDIFYFYLYDNQAHDHHTYWTHIPFYWLLIGFLSMIVSLRWKNTSHVFGIFFLNVFVHLILDTLVGGILWTHPVSETDQMIRLFTVPTVYEPKLVYGFFEGWMLNMFIHWSFFVEVVICTSAFAVLTKKHFAKKADI